VFVSGKGLNVNFNIYSPQKAHHWVMMRHLRHRASVVHYFQNITTCFPKFKDDTWP